MIASSAAPCKGPHNEAIPAEIQANGFAFEEAAIRTVLDEGPCSWSACNMKILSIVERIVGWMDHSDPGSLNIIIKKFSTKPSLESG